MNNKAILNTPNNNNLSTINLIPISHITIRWANTLTSSIPTKILINKIRCKQWINLWKTMLLTKCNELELTPKWIILKTPLKVWSNKPTKVFGFWNQKDLIQEHNNRMTDSFSRNMKPSVKNPVSIRNQKPELPHPIPKDPLMEWIRNTSKMSLNNPKINFNIYNKIKLLIKMITIKKKIFLKKVRILIHKSPHPKLNLRLLAT